MGGGRVARLFCQRGGALEGLVGPCDAGVHTAQEQGQGETAGKRQCKSVSGAEWHDGARALLGLRGGPFSFFLFLRKQMGSSRGRILRNSDQNLKQSEAYSAASLPAGPEIHCFARYH